WASRDMLGIDVGISLLMAENARSQFVWQTFMKNPEARLGMERAGFSPLKQAPLLYAANQPAALALSTGRKLVSTAATRVVGKS
ncbi:MAG TPA: glucoamylase family protein, partial [Terriglobales bacterium]|nr:glucoamylase family protein [Terriglobales bacterium]